MHENKINYFEKIDEPKHREFINLQNNCILCGTVLELRHVREKEEIQIKEEAYCTQCEMRTRAKIFALH